MDPGYVAFIDALGFSEIARDPVLLGEYLLSLQTIEPEESSYVVFSDSIVLTIKGLERDRFVSICRTTARLMWQLLTREFPVRAAIAAGQFQRTEFTNGNVFVAGAPIVEAYNYEQMQDWIGVMIAPSARKLIPDLPERCNPQVLASIRDFGETLDRGDLAFVSRIQRWGIPFKPDQVDIRPAHQGFAIVPAYGDAPKEIEKDLQHVRESLDWLRDIAPSPAEQRKYGQTLEFVSAVHVRWMNLAIEMRRAERKSGDQRIGQR